MVTGSSTKPGLNSTQSRELILGASLSRSSWASRAIVTTKAQEERNEERYSIDHGGDAVHDARRSRTAVGGRRGKVRGMAQEVRHE